MYEKHPWKSDILTKDAGHQASKMQLPSFFINEFNFTN